MQISSLNIFLVCCIKKIMFGCSNIRTQHRSAFCLYEYQLDIRKNNHLGIFRRRFNLVKLLHFVSSCAVWNVLLQFPKAFKIGY